ncbi:MAG: elongation factor Ts [Gammaproteobacteria bacterium]|nr:elongation factor Ts [Gammaproteobacteria bacterium]
MAAITADMVKQLRERTGAGMMDCKKALTEADGDIEKAIENMRTSGLVKAAKKAGRVAAEGVVLVKAAGNAAVMIELNSETDFVARDANFVAFGQKLVDVALTSGAASVEQLNAADFDGQTVDQARTALVAKIGENIQIRRVARLSDVPVIGAYLHGSRIGVLVAMQGGDAELAKDVAMHVAANRPDFVSPDQVSAEVVEKERHIQIELAINSGKPKEIAEKMVEGRMKKFTHEVSLTGQQFVKDPSITVADLLAKANASVSTFICFKVGEGIEKEESDFAAEVAAQVAAAQKG